MTKIRPINLFNEGLRSASAARAAINEQVFQIAIDPIDPSGGVEDQMGEADRRTIGIEGQQAH